MVIFVVKNRALGGSIMGLSSIQYLRKMHPTSTIIYAVPEWIAPLYRNVSTTADVIYPLKLNSFFDILNLYTDLINLQVDAIHEMHQSGRGGKVFSFFCFIKNIPYTFHNHHLKSGTKVYDQGVIKELIQRDLDGVFSFYGNNKRPDFLNYEPILNSDKKLKKEKMVIMGVVATRKTKMWPLENYIKLAQLICKKYPDFQIVLPLSHSTLDQSINDKLLTLGIPANTSIVHWSLEELPLKFFQSLFYIGNDTGLKHLAVSAGLKTFTFFGPEPSLEWHPYDRNKHVFFYREDLSCRTRTHHYCGLSDCNLEKDFMQCLTYFEPEQVFKEIESYI